ncbi:MAG: protein translocase subunit SecD [Polyangiales bacterium]
MLRQCGELVSVIAERNKSDDVDRATLQKVRERCDVQPVDDGGISGRRISVTFNDRSDIGKFTKVWLKDHFSDLRVVSGAGTRQVLLTLREDQLNQLRENAVRQAVRTIGDRIDTLGLREATVIGRESDIIVEVPGADQSSFDRIKAIISRTARLEFKIVDDEANTVALFQSVPAPEGVEIQNDGRPFAQASGEGSRERLLAYLKSIPLSDIDHEFAIGRVDAQPGADGTVPAEAWRSYYLFKVAEATGEDLEDASVGFDKSDPVVTFQMNTRGADKMSELTRKNLGKRMAVVLDDRVESAPTIQGEIGARGQITLGRYANPQQLLSEAKDLSVVLQAGALPAPLRPANEQLIGPTLGRDSVRKGAEAAVIGVLAVLVFMLVYYEVGGLVADVMVLLNVLLLMAIMAAFEATLTLPGIAAIALTVGMAVDANVLINERIREELRLGKSPRAAVEQGFARAYSSVFDSQLTTAIAGIVLLQFGTGPIKGFATMLLIGIATSLFTGTFCSKVFFDWIVRGLGVQRLRVG